MIVLLDPGIRLLPNARDSRLSVHKNGPLSWRALSQPKPSAEIPRAAYPALTCEAILCKIWALGRAPVIDSFASPPTKSMSVGML